jgi:predicted pyridoxine 5'-phosphate oxidase superfamily flavin-nucleotide-binding protein
MQEKQKQLLISKVAEAIQNSEVKVKVVGSVSKDGVVELKSTTFAIRSKATPNVADKPNVPKQDPKSLLSNDGRRT